MASMKMLKRLLALPLALTLVTAAATVSSGLILAYIFMPEIVSVDFGLQLALAFVPGGLLLLLVLHRKRR
jgi:hypothetical protein